MSIKKTGKASEKASEKAGGKGWVQPMFRDELDFLSNFHPAPFAVAYIGVVPTGEHAFWALRTLDEAERTRVVLAETPAEARRIGATVTPRPGWEHGGAMRAMMLVVEYKFTRPDLAELLVATGDLELVETNYWHDQRFGCCRCPRHAAIPGANLLGQLLMARRDELITPTLPDKSIGV